MTFIIFLLDNIDNMSFNKKFKAYHKLNKKFYKVKALYDDGSATLIDEDNTLLIKDSQNIEIIQNCGVSCKDDNGNEIELYEGDLIKFENKIYAITFWLGSFSLALKYSDSINHFTFSDFDSDEINNFIFIGTIYDI